jgi:hypothetical protein
LQRRRAKISQLTERQKGLAFQQGWLIEKDPSCGGPRCSSTDEDGETEESPAHELPSLKVCCTDFWSCCPCCADDRKVKAAKAELASLESGGQASEAELDAAKAKVSAEESALSKDQQTKFSSSIGVCQTAITMPCMVGM